MNIKSNKIFYCLFGLGLIALLSHVANQLGDVNGIRDPVIEILDTFASYAYMVTALFIFAPTPILIYRIYKIGTMEGLFVDLYGLRDDYTKEDLPVVREKINKKVFAGEGQALFYMYLILAIVFGYMGMNGLCQVTLSIVIVLRVLGICFKSLLIGILRDLDWAEENGVSI